MKNIYKYFKFSLLILMMGFASALYGQNEISGRITDETGSPLPGVSVLVKGTTTGTSTDNEGRYNLSAPADAVLTVSFIGFGTKEVPVENRTIIDISLEPEVTALQEIVVTGYTTQNRKDITGAVSIVKTSDLLATPSGNLQQQLQGRVAGVVTSGTGVPGAGAKVRVRGFGSFGNNDPLYIIDGVPSVS